MCSITKPINIFFCYVASINIFCQNYDMSNKQTGRYGEEIACEFLKKQGFKILETNYRYSKISEIDIIALKSDIIHFIEVKTRHSEVCGNPLEAITKTKLNSIIKCSKSYLSKTNIHYKKMQIDAIGITLNNNQKPEINFIQNISLN